MTSKILSTVLGKLSPSQPTVESKKLAAVSVIIAGRTNPRTLLIKRAERASDPWSGQVAFPGGRMATGDPSAKETAIREAREETSLDLSKDASFSGYHKPFGTHTGEMDVIPAVFLMGREAKVVPNSEVSSYRWVGLDEFQSPRSAPTYSLKLGVASRDMPAFVIGDYVVWGLTHRIISSLLGLDSV